MRTLPLHHAIRNAGRSPVRSLLLVFASSLVAGLLVVTGSFVRSLERSHLGAAPPCTAILLSSSSLRDVIRSAMSPAVADLVAADVPGVVRADGVPASSPEIHMGSNIQLQGDDTPRPAALRGVTARAYLVHETVTLVDGRMPGPREALVGRLAAAKCGFEEDALAPGAILEIEGGTFEVSGVFAAPGTTIESEIWLPLGELQGLAQRDDCSAVFVRVGSSDDLTDVDLFAKRRLDLELICIPARQYYAELAAYFDPILALAWAMTAMTCIAATMGGANTVITAVQSRTREIAALRAIGFRNSSLSIAVVQEIMTLSMAGALLGLVAARLLLAQVSVRMAMTAFRIELDPASVLAGLVGTLLIALAGATPALLRMTRLPVARALKED
jgi:putative ABC transport system permease protein